MEEPRPVSDNVPPRRFETHRDLFTPDEAAAYLKLRSVEALHKLRANKLLVGFDGWTTYMLYHRDDLDRCALRMCGRDPDAGKVQLRSDPPAPRKR